MQNNLIPTQNVAVLDNQKLYFIHSFVYSFIHPNSSIQLPRTYKHCASDVNRERKEGRKPRKMNLTHVFLSELTL